MQTCCAVSHWPSATLVPGEDGVAPVAHGQTSKSVACAGC